MKSSLFRMVFLTVATLTFFIFTGCSSGGNTSLTPTQQAIADTATPATHQQLISGGGGFSGRLTMLPSLPSVQTLIADGTAATPDILTKFAATPTMALDDQLVACAYVLSQTHDTRAIQGLINFLSENMTGDVLWSLDSTTRTLKVLTGQADVHITPPTYSPLDMLDTITRAHSWLSAHPAVAVTQLISRRKQRAPINIAMGYIRIYLTDAAGNPYFWNNPQDGGASERVQFDLRIYRDPRVLTAGSGLPVVSNGGTFISGSEGSEAQTGLLGICGGYALREMLRVGGSATPQGGWNLDPLDVCAKLFGAGLIFKQPDTSKAKVADLVFWQKGANPATHAAIIQSVPPTTSSIIVRNKDETSGVFTAAIDALYYNNASIEKIFGTPFIYTYTNGEIPHMMVDMTMTQTTPLGTKIFLQNASIVVE